MRAFPSTRLEFLTSIWPVQCQEEQAQPTKPLEAQAPRTDFDLETMNTELSSPCWPNQVVVCSNVFLTRPRNFDFLALRRQRSARALCSHTHVPQAPKCHLGTNLAPPWLEHVIQLPLEGTQRYWGHSPWVCSSPLSPLCQRYAPRALFAFVCLHLSATGSCSGFLW